MRATTLCLICCCLAPPARALADEPPRRLPAAGVAASDKRAQESDAPAPIERAAFVEGKTAADDPRPLPRKTGASRALRPRGAGQATALAGEANERGGPLGGASSAMTGLASLAVVLGLFFAVVWAMRRGMPAGPALLPREAVEVLGRTPLAGRQQAHLVRCGNKVLLVYLAQGVAETLTEITDPLEVDRLVGLCRQAHPQSTTASFRQVLQQFGREKPTVGGAA